MSKSKIIAKNTLFLYFRMMLTMVVSLYTSRVVLNSLGVEDFGVYNVVGGVVTMFVFLSGAMSSSTQRFLAFEIGKGDSIMLKKTFNVTLVIHIFIALFIYLLIETFGVWLLNNFLKIPSLRMEEAKWVYHFSALSFLVSIIRVPFNSLIIAHEKMKVYAYIGVLEVLLKLVIVFLLTRLSYDKLILYGFLVLFVDLFIACIYIIYAKINFIETKFEIVKDKKLFKILLSYSGWSLFGNFALVAKGQAVTILLNVFFGPLLNAAQGIANQVNAAVQSFYSSFQMAVNPQIIKSYSSGENMFMISLMNKSARFSFYLLFIIALPILLQVEIVLELWLKVVPKYATDFTLLVLIVILLDSISGPLITGINATGKIKIFQIIVGSLQILVMPMTYLLFWLGFSPISTYLLSVLISLIALFTRLYIIKKIIKEFSAKVFLREVFFNNIIIVLLSLILPLFFKFYLIKSMISFFIIILMSILSSIIFIYLIGLKSDEKNILVSGVKKIIFKK